MTIREQAAQWLADAVSRKKDPISNGTFTTYRSYLDRHILPMIGSIDLVKFRNKQMREFISALAAKGLSSSTLNGIVTIAKEIQASAIDEEGEPLYPVQWNNEFCDLPRVKITDRDVKFIDAASLQDALNRVPSHYTPFLALLAGSGLRVGEAKALGVGPGYETAWLPSTSVLVIKNQRTRGRVAETKTEAGVREVDLPGNLNRYLIETLGTEPRPAMFTGKRGGPLNNVDYNEFRVIGMPPCHSLRRFRCTHLENVGVPDNLAHFWTGHAKKRVHDRYIEYSTVARREWAEKAGLGFELPQQL